jgi:hypothetical protein
VVAFDVGPGQPFDLVPLAAHPDLASAFAGMDQLMEPLRNSYWFSHKLLKSNAQVVYGNIYDLPSGIGLVDIATFGSILLHLRDPFLALANAARFVRETIIVTDCFHGIPSENVLMGRPPVAPRLSYLERAARKLTRLTYGTSVVQNETAEPGMIPAMAFLPSAEDPDVINRLNSWWFFTPAVIQRMLGVLGFETSAVTHHHQRYQKEYTLPLYTVVAKRTRPMPKRIDGPYPWY